MRYLFAGVAGIALWIALAVYLAFAGVWMSSVVAPDDTDGFHAWAVGELTAHNAGSAALVLLEDAVPVHSHFNGPGGRINEDTLFPTASFSKWVTALGVMALVERGELDLDAPVGDYLARWQLPPSEYDNNAVTVRRLLSHTAGLTDGLGFGDYLDSEVVPVVEAELRRPRASSGGDVVVAVGIEPGTEFQYSGGGYLLLQLLVEEVTGTAFADYIRGAVLDPLGMARSSYAFLGSLDNVSPSYDTDGSVAPTYQYASSAATGFASSAADLTRLTQAMLSADGRLLLAPGTTRQMREPHGFLLGAGIWGLGTILYAPTANDDYVFGHDGGNDPAINSTVRLNPDTADGIVVLVSGHPSLASNIGSEWVLWQTGAPDFLQVERAVKSAVIPIIAGGVLIFVIVALWWRRR